MPIYEYECVACRKQFERLVFHNLRWVRCPVCHNVSRRLISKSSFRLKGGGWAKDNYSKKED
jgi:putative FmdB family regulatory protein